MTFIFYDEETGLYYLNSRYYNPEWGRFINADEYITTEQGILSYNMYLYTENNPINRIDYLGKNWIKIICFLGAGVAIAVGIKALSNLKENHNVSDGLVIAGLIGFSSALVAAANFGSIATIGLASLLSIGIDLRFNYSSEEKYTENLIKEIAINSITAIIPSYDFDKYMIRAINSHFVSSVLGSKLSYAISFSPLPDRKVTPNADLNKQRTIPPLDQKTKSRSNKPTGTSCNYNPIMGGSVLGSLVINKY